jgi:hypothetical protein
VKNENDHAHAHAHAHEPFGVARGRYPPPVVRLKRAILQALTHSNCATFLGSFAPQRSRAHPLMLEESPNSAVIWSKAREHGGSTIADKTEADGSVARAWSKGQPARDAHVRGNFAR